MKKLLKSKYLVGLVGFLLGAASLWAVQSFSAKTKNPLISPVALAKPLDPLLDDFFDKGFFDRSADPFEEMRRMREGMMKQFNKEEGSGLFDAWYSRKFGGGSAGDISQREDEHFVYYEIAVDGLKEKNVKIKVENGQISISGEVEKRSEEGNSKSYFVSRFQRSYPVPLNVDSEKVQIDQGAGRLTVKFPKLPQKSV